METNYELKHKCLLVPLKAVLLVLAMLLVGFTTYAQSGKSVRVATNEQLIEAMQNPSIGRIELQAGYYAYLNYQAEDGAWVAKAKQDGGNRDVLCLYYIIGETGCFEPLDDPYPGYDVGTAQAGFIEPFPGCNCCPPFQNYPGAVWSVTSKPSPTADVIFDTPALETTTFWFNEPGEYILRYSWPAPFNSLVETQYIYYGPVTIDLTADNVCEADGLSTTVNFAWSSAFPEPGTIISWTLNGAPYAGPTVSGPFTLTVPECGPYVLGVTVDPTDCPPVYEEIVIWFDCEPLADAGPDIAVCNDMCVSLDGNVTVAIQSPSFAYSWVNISGPQDQTLTFSPDGGFMQTDVEACRDEFISDPPCPYGEYEVQLQVQNGLCYADDNALVRFYQQPTANAGPDQHLCNTFSAQLAAVPFGYCGTEGVNFWATSYWEIVSKADPNAVIAFVPSINDPNAVVTITSTADCPYGEYTFRWVEVNSAYPQEGCTASDDVSIFIYEDPAPNAGPDLVFCNTFAFSLWGIGDEPCYEGTVVEYSWAKTCQPGDAQVFITDGNTANPDIEIISITGSTACDYGKYCFEFTQCNGYLDGNDQFQDVCCSTDSKEVWILEEAAADAGPDQHICYSFEVTLGAIPTNFCGTAGVNYFTWGMWEFVSGPADVIITDINDPNSTITIDDMDECPYGVYKFKWTEYNGFGTPFQGCSDWDEVEIYMYEQPDVDAGENLAFCDQFSFYLDGSLEPLCNTAFQTQIIWSVVSSPALCDITFTPQGGLDPMVDIANCNACPYGDYVFMVRAETGFYNELQEWQTVCFDEDQVTVTIYEHPDQVDAGDPQLLCDDFTFDLAADLGEDYCGANSPWYSWAVVSTPDPTCTITFSAQTSPATSVEVSGCTGECAYGEYVFSFTEWNGLEDCYSTDLVTVTILEMPDADAGADVAECVGPNDDLCYDMTAELDYCYSMMGLWTKSCGPGDVVFSDVNDPNAEACFEEPGRYKFTWKVWNAAEGCEDEDEVIFDLLEQPVASADAREIYTECNTLCVDLGLAGVNKYVYIGTDQGECPNYQDFAHWTVVSGPGVVTFDPAETAPDADICVDAYGGYTFRWNEINKSVDGLLECSDYVDVYVEFNETPEPQAEGGEICGNCFDLNGTLDAGFNPSFYWEFISGPGTPTFDPNEIDPEVCIEDYPENYGLYTFVLHQFNGECEGTATATILFKDLPDPVAICYKNFANECGPDPGPPPIDPQGCLTEDDVLYACAEGNSVFFMGPDCQCVPGFDWNNPLYYGWTFEWSLTGPAGTDVWSFNGYYDFDEGMWHYPTLYVTWGECCDTARIYLTITTDEQCELTLEYKVYVYHKPCVDIVGPEVAEVGLLELGVPYEYCNNCPPNPCLLYTWTAEPCGHIVYGQGTPCIGVEWDSYVINDGWGEITLTVFDTCTGCCNYDSYPVKVYPSGTLGTAVLSGHVYYENNFNTPLNGVEIQLWNGNVPVMSTVSFNDIEGGNGVGYYEFTNLSAATSFGVTASYGAPWYGANATDALAVELRSLGMSYLPVGFVYDDVVEAAMNVNNSVVPLITSVDALWIKQRAINMVNYFPAGNWAFDQTMQTTATVGYDVYALSMGDANRSNIPNSNFKSLSVDMITDGMMNVVNGQEFELPVRIAEADVFGAMTLHLDYNPAMIEVVDVVAMEGMLSNISGNTVSIAWSNTNPMALADNDVVITLKAKAIGEIASTESALTVGYGSEFADPTAKVIEPVTLKTFGVTTEPAALDYFLSSNRPNPFSTSTFIEYTMPETGKVKLSVLDMLGQELAVLVDATQNAGSYTVEFSAAGLATGVYLYKITVDGETRDFISTQRMVVSH